ncbi:NADP-dependent oxidoreductase domain-containing protein [Ilyonectria robusta]|uniref:NADP-dependent oxidoreductase domain-containing protein n=1 Tax=Ilyonectria robusta TaxID=1079257 RepID=UPI001E8E1732|nr:NADP-dependent oxidoreductase domain-containing protein [Ilyonectria robusta]KAH8648855.1 NADP-dependent oxidoreductase domain-containing protein [Ilyonectria robusta]
MSALKDSKLVAISVGTHTWRPDDEKVDKIVAILKKHNVKNLDTAFAYGQGLSEQSLGKRNLAAQFAIDTKADTAIIPGSGRSIAAFTKKSLEGLQTEKVRVYLLHGPDESTPFSEQIEILQKLYKEGIFEKLGISNFTKDQVLDIYNAAKSKDYVLPTVYQSSYSLIVRRNEAELFPTLRELGFSLQAYSPMGNGFLAKTPEYIEQGRGSWDPNTPYGQIQRDLFYKPSYLKLLKEFGQLSEDSGVSRVGLAYRWVRFHSVLDGNLGDEMIIGGATTEQVEESLVELEKGPLEPWVVKRIDELWEIVKDHAPVDILGSARKVARTATYNAKFLDTNRTSDNA